MRKEYDFSKAQKNPYAGKLKRQVTIRMDEGTISYFKELAREIDIPYQTLINLYLRECAASHKKPSFSGKRHKSRNNHTLNTIFPKCLLSLIF